MPGTTTLSFRPADDEDFPYIYRLCESTMRAYVEADFGDCFEQLARPTIQGLVQGGKFSTVHVAGALVGAVAHERHETHLQLEEIYVEPARQNQGLGTEILQHLIEHARSTGLPIRLHVLASNPARRLYERLGFHVTRSTREVTYLEYHPRGPDDT